MQMVRQLCPSALLSLLRYTCMKQISICIYRSRLCCVCELKFEPRDFLHHIRAAGHHGDSRATVYTHRAARAP